MTVTIYTDWKGVSHWRWYESRGIELVCGQWTYPAGFLPALEPERHPTCLQCIALLDSTKKD